MKKGASTKKAARIGWATVNKKTGGGKAKSGGSKKGYSNGSHRSRSESRHSTSH